jgi:hypothetical protein
VNYLDFIDDHKKNMKMYSRTKANILQVFIIQFGFSKSSHPSIHMGFMFLLLTFVLLSLDL